MRVLIVIAALLATAPAWAGPVGLAVGVYGGVNLSPLDDPEPGGLLGAKARLTLPGGMLAVEGRYTRVSHEDAEQIWADADPWVVLNGDGFDLYAADLLLGAMSGPSPVRWHISAGLNLKEVPDLSGGSEIKPGAQAGLGLELAMALTGLAIEVRGEVVALDWTQMDEGTFATATAGLNYAF